MKCRYRESWRTSGLSHVALRFAALVERAAKERTLGPIRNNSAELSKPRPNRLISRAVIGRLPYVGPNLRMQCVVA